MIDLLRAYCALRAHKRGIINIQSGWIYETGKGYDYTNKRDVGRLTVRCRFCGAESAGLSMPQPGKPVAVITREKRSPEEYALAVASFKLRGQR